MSSDRVPETTRDSGEGTSPWRTLVDVTQSQRKGAKEDLAAHFTALQAHPACAGLVEVATAPTLDAAALRALVQVVGGRAEFPEDGVTQVWVPVSADSCPDELGGGPVSGEWGRWVGFTVRHATWRDRRVRRLAAVRVVAGVLGDVPSESLLQAAASPH